MGTNQVVLEKTQFGLESSYGVDVAATRKAYVTGVGRYDRELRVNSDRTGTRAGRRRGSYKRPDIGFTFEAECTFEDQPWWNQLALKGGVTGTNDGSGAYTYNFVPNINALDTKSATIEFGEPSLVYKSHQVLIDEWNIKIDPDNESAWQWSATALARDWDTSSYTGSISERTTEPIPAPGTLLYIDNAGGTIGTTPVNGKLISATITGKNNFHLEGFAEDKLAYPAGKIGFGEQEYDCEIVFAWDGDGEFANYRTNTVQPVQRLVRLESSGASPIHTTVYKRARIDLYGSWSTWSPGDRDGSKIFTMNLMGIYDVTAAYALRSTIVNALSTLV